MVFLEQALFSTGLINLPDRRVSLGKGFEMIIPENYEELKRQAEEDIEKMLQKYPKALKLWHLLNSDPEVKASWDIADYIAVQKLKYNDHGEVHAKIVAANSLKMLKILLEHNILPDVMKEHAGDEDDAHLIVLAGSLLHDLGNSVHRELHPLHSVYMAIPILNRLLPQIYEELEIAYEMRNHILHCIYSHGEKVKDLTIEASLVGIADGTDMTKGRGRLAFDTGNVNIHTVSALSIEKVTIVKGETKPIKILVEMSNSAGVFQVEETLGPKIRDSPLEKYIEIEAFTRPEGENDKRIVHRVLLSEGKVIPQ